MPKTCQTMTYMPNNFEKAEFLQFGMTNANLGTLAKDVCVQQSHVAKHLLP